VAELKDELRQRLPEELFSLLEERQGPARLLRELGKAFPASLSYTGDPRRAWEMTGLYYLRSQRPAEALELFHAMYDQDLQYQELVGGFLSKGTPLVWIGECHAALQRQFLAKRYYMMALCDDAVEQKGLVSTENTGSYFRLVWRYSLPDALFRSYAASVHEHAVADPVLSRYPEWLLLKLDDRWVSSPPSIPESHYYRANSWFIRRLLASLGDGTGRSLEELAQYLLGEIPGCRVTRRQRSYSTDYDLVCSIAGVETDFRSELGRYFVGECKDWSVPADFSTMAKFCRILDSVKCRFGVLFSREGITGESRTTDAAREQLKVFQDRGNIIVVVSRRDIDDLAEGADLIVMLRDKYEKVRLDLQ
jgi:hypothetical protein